MNDDTLTPTPKPKSVLLRIEERENGLRVEVYDNGMERNADTKKLMRPPTRALLTPESANLLQRKRWENFRRESNSRIVREAAAIDPSVRTPSQAYGLLASKQFVALMDYDKPRIDELEKLGQIMSGYYPSLDRERGDTGQSAIAAALQAGTAQVLERLWRDVAEAQRRQGVEVVDANVQDTD